MLSETAPRKRLYWTYPLPCLALMLILAGFIVCLKGIDVIERVFYSEEPLPQVAWIAEPLHAGEFMMALGVVVLIVAYHAVKRDQQATYWTAKTASQQNANTGDSEPPSTSS